MIIVEGADNVGKSTLVQQLIELDPSLHVMHRPRYRPGQGETIADSYLRALSPPADDYAMLAHSIADRFLASECIYGQLFRGGCRITRDQHMLIRGLLIQFNAMIVWCNPPDDAIKATWREREQLYSEAESLGIAHAYRALLPEVFRGFPVIRYDWTTEHADAMRGAIVHAHSLQPRTPRLYPIPCRLPPETN